MKFADKIFFFKSLCFSTILIFPELVNVHCLSVYFSRFVWKYFENWSATYSSIKSTTFLIFSRKNRNMKMKESADTTIMDIASLVGSVTFVTIQTFVSILSVTNHHVHWDTQGPVLTIFHLVFASLEVTVIFFVPKKI